MHTARPISEIRAALLRGELSPADLIENALSTAVWRKKSGAKVYLQLDPGHVRSQIGRAPVESPLGSLPVSVKDCFDVAGEPATAGSQFYASTRPVPSQDSWFAARARGAGGVLMGKTNLNEFAYGITGENLHFGNCEVPARPGCLTGGSSSGAAASVAEGSAVIGLGTDTGGSLRAPASFCGLVSLRPTHGSGDFSGCFPLAQTFDTMGFLIRHLADMPLVASALLGIGSQTVSTPRIGLPDGDWLDGCTPDVVENLAAFAERLRGAGCSTHSFETASWTEAGALFIPIQAYEAFANHRDFLPRFRDQYEPAVRQRIEFGGTVTKEAYDRYEQRRQVFRELQTTRLFREFDFLAVPICPVRELQDGADHSGFRSRILSLTTPASVCGWPVLTVRGRGNGPEDPAAHGYGIGLMARPGADDRLMGLATWLAQRGF